MYVHTNRQQAPVALPSAQTPRRPVLFYNPRSGGGKADRFSLPSEARARGIEPVELSPGDDYAALVRAHVARGADALAMAGGDGSQAMVAAVASEHSLPYACVPAGTRNHFALDLGVDRDDVVGALDAFVDGAERVVDLADVNGRVFVNNVSLGIYGEAVQRPGYRNAKLRTLLEAIPQAIDPRTPDAELRWTDPDGGRKEGNPTCWSPTTLPSRRAYRVAGSRPARRGVSASSCSASHRCARRCSDRPRCGVRGPLPRSSSSPVPQRLQLGVDGEAVRLEVPLHFRTRPGALKFASPADIPERRRLRSDATGDPALAPRSRARRRSRLRRCHADADTEPDEECVGSPGRPTTRGCGSAARRFSLRHAVVRPPRCRPRHRVRRGRLGCGESSDQAALASPPSGSERDARVPPRPYAGEQLVPVRPLRPPRLRSQPGWVACCRSKRSRSERSHPSSPTRASTPGCTTRRMCSPERFSAPRSRSSSAGLRPELTSYSQAQGCLSRAARDHHRAPGHEGRGRVTWPDLAGCAPGYFRGGVGGGQASLRQPHRRDTFPSTRSSRGRPSGCRLRRAGVPHRARQARGAAGDRGSSRRSRKQVRPEIDDHLPVDILPVWWMHDPFGFGPDADDDLSVDLFRHRPNLPESATRSSRHSMS